MVGDHPDRKLCPVRALKAYLERTKEPEVRHGRARLFLDPKTPESDISPVHISIWIKKLVQGAHEHAGVEYLCLAKVSSLFIRKFSASWAVFNNVPFDDIMQAARSVFFCWVFALTLSASISFPSGAVIPILQIGGFSPTS